MLGLVLAFPALAEPPGISLASAVDEARHAPSVAVAASARVAAKAAYDQAWPNRLPTLTATGNVLVYNEAQEMQLFTSDTPLDCTGIPDPFGSLCTSFGDPIVVRDQVTTSLTAQVAVPLTGQVAVDRQVAAAKGAWDAAKASERGAVADAVQEAEEAWFSAAQAEEQLAIATSQVVSLEQRARVAQASFDSGGLTRNDLLLVRIALGQARQAQLQLEGYRDLAYIRLGVAVGNGGSPVRPDGSADTPPREPPPADGLVTRALTTRPELEALRAQAQAAKAGAAAASWARLPSIAGIGAYQHTTGQGAFGSPDTAYVGLSLNWTVWAFGKAAAGVTGAKAQAEEVAHQLEQVEAGVRMDVLARVQALRNAAAAWALADDTVTQAKENLAIQERRQQTGTGTMQEVLDANTALVRATSTKASALYDARRAEAGLVHAVGADPWAEGR